MQILVAGLVIAIITLGVTSIGWVILYGRGIRMPRKPKQRPSRPGDDGQFGTWPSIRVPHTSRPSTPDTPREHT